MITNSILAEKLNVPIGKVRRWTKELLPPDPKATRRSGYTREFTDVDAYFVYLGGYIVSTLGFSFHEARKILEEIRPWIFEIGLTPEVNFLRIRKGIDSKFRPTMLKINIYSNPESEDYALLVDGVVSIKKDTSTSNGRTYNHWKRESATYWLKHPKRDIEEYAPHKTFHVGILLEEYIKNLYGKKEWIEWFAYWQDMGEAENLK